MRNVRNGKRKKWENRNVGNEKWDLKYLRNGKSEMCKWKR